MSKLPNAQTLQNLGFAVGDIKAALIRSCEDDFDIPLKEAIEIVEAALEANELGTFPFSWDECIDDIAEDMIRKFAKE